jgi:hypothetical protein
MRVPALILALSLIAAPAAFATEAPVPRTPAPATETPAPALAAKEVNTTPARAEAQEVRTERVEVASRQMTNTNIFWLIGVVVVVVAVASLVLR